MRRLIVLLLVILPALGGCGHVISREARRAVDKEVAFARVKADPEAFIGRTLLLGGVIVDTAVERTGTTLEVFRWRLDSWGEPAAVDEDGGRFLVHTDRFLDPALYAPGRLVTLTATVAGQQTRPLGPTTYTYPVFTLGEIYLWDTPFRYGLYPHPNVYVPDYVGPEDRERTNPYDPGYYYYPYTPYWIRPPGR